MGESMYGRGTTGGARPVPGPATVPGPGTGTTQKAAPRTAPEPGTRVPEPETRVPEATVPGARVGAGASGVREKRGHG
ncbi:hypothetical protein E3E14_19560 [Streptomyces sp. ICN441]|nr:hypothetical protein E3E14_19560 [Streptomyces sp. ICN441]